MGTIEWSCNWSGPGRRAASDEAHCSYVSPGQHGDCTRFDSLNCDNGSARSNTGECGRDCQCRIDGDRYR